MQVSGSPAHDLESALQKVGERLGVRVEGFAVLTSPAPTVVARSGERYSLEHDAELAKFGFVEGKKTIRIEGFTAGPVKLPEAVATKLTTSRPIGFFHSSDRESPPVSLKQGLLYPPAVAVDLVTSPLQLIGIGALIVLIEANGGLQVIR
jgi:hypothetical protein